MTEDAKARLAAIREREQGSVATTSRGFGTYVHAEGRTHHRTWCQAVGTPGHPGFEPFSFKPERCNCGLWVFAAEARSDIKVLLEALALSEQQREQAESQINQLATFIMEQVPEEASQSEGAVECAIRLMRQRDALKAALERFVYWHGGAHEALCPEDDTCDCAGKPINDAVNAALKEFAK